MGNLRESADKAKPLDALNALKSSIEVLQYLMTLTLPNAKVHEAPALGSRPEKASVA